MLTIGAIWRVHLAPRLAFPGRQPTSNCTSHTTRRGVSEKDGTAGSSMIIPWHDLMTTTRLFWVNGTRWKSSLRSVIHRHSREQGSSTAVASGWYIHVALRPAAKCDDGYTCLPVTVDLATQNSKKLPDARLLPLLLLGQPNSRTKHSPTRDAVTAQKQEVDDSGLVSPHIYHAQQEPGPKGDESSPSPLS